MTGRTPAPPVVREATAAEAAALDAVLEDISAAIGAAIERHVLAQGWDHPTTIMVANTAAIHVCRALLAGMAAEDGVRGMGLPPGAAVDLAVATVVDRDDLVARLRRRMT